jgi:hypothetical protein
VQASSTGTASRPADPPQPPPGHDRGWIRSGLALAAVSAAILAFFLSIYVRRDIPVPLGWDTSRYLWQTSFVQAEGLDALREPLPPPYKTSLSRPAFPVIAATTSSVTGVSTFRVAAVLPAVMAVVIAVAAGAFVSSTLRRPLWELLAVAIAVGTSAYVVRLAAPEAYQDNLSAAAILLAACVPVVHSVAGGRGLVVPSIALLAVGAMTHWSFFLFFAGVLAASGLALLPGSWKQWRSGTPLFATPAGRLGLILGGGGLLGAGALYGLLGAGSEQPKFSRPEFRKKLRLDVPKYRLPVALPLAAIGAGALLAGRPRSPVPAGNGEGAAGHDEARAARRYVAVLLTAWVLVAAAGVAAFLAGMLLPAHRFLAFALSLPILGVLGVMAIGRWIAGRDGAVARTVVAGVVVVGVVVLSAASSYAAWDDQPSWARMDRDKVTQAAVAAAYLDEIGVPDEEPFVFIVDDRGPNPDAYVGLMTHMIRASIPAERLRALHIYAGDPEDFLEGRPSLDGGPAHDRVSERFLEALEPILAERPVAFVAAALNDHSWGMWIEAHPETRVGSDVALVQGPAPVQAVAIPQLSIGPLPAYQWVLFGGGLVAVFGLIGLGWTLALLGPRLRRFEVLALSPAVGLAAIVLFGILSDRAGILLQGLPGAAVPLGAGALGWASWALLRRRDRAPAPA